MNSSNNLTATLEEFYKLSTSQLPYLETEGNNFLFT